MGTGSQARVYFEDKEEINNNNKKKQQHRNTSGPLEKEFEQI